MCVGKASVVAMSKAFHPPIKMKLKTASKTITPVFDDKNQMKKADNDDIIIETPEKENLFH